MVALPATVEAVIFDMDGVVTDTASVHAAAWKALFDAYLERRAADRGEPFVPFDADADYRQFVDGRPRNDGVRAFLESRGVRLAEGELDDSPDADTVCGLGNRKNGYFLARLRADGARSYPTTVELVHALHAAGVPCAVISASRNMTEVLDAAGLAGLFEVRVDGVVTHDLGLRGKPQPDVFLEAARRMGVEVARCAIVEDAIAGVDAGRRGRFGFVVGVDRTGDADALRRMGADVVVADLAELALPPLDRARRSIGALPDALEHLGELRARLDDRRMAVFLDYDGTLTPIVDDPARALLSDTAREAIRRLAASVPVVIVSGRDLEDVRRLVALDGIWFAGSHGFEIRGPDGSSHERAPETLPALDAAERDLAARIEPIDGARLERKRYALAVHYRLATPDRIPAVSDAVEVVAAAHPDLRRTGGKKVFELRPNLDWDKGRAIEWLLQTLGLDRPEVVPLYVGDDETDEDAFRALGRRGIGIVVRGEADDRPTAAAFALASPEQTAVLLDMLGAAR